MATNTTTISSAIVPAPNDVLNNLLATLKAGLILAGVQNPVLDSNSQFYITATALANQLNIGFQQLLVMLGALMPDTATGADLDRLANFYGIYRRAATSSDLIVTVSFGPSTYVPAAAQLVSNNGLIYQVTTGTLLTQVTPGGDTGTVEIISIDTGSQTALAVGDILSWIDQPAFVKATVVVADVAGEGIDIENDSALRTRLLNTLQNPPQYGNWSQIASTAENASPLIEKAYVYPAANGPSTQYVVFTQAQTPSNIANRAVTFNSLPWIQAYSAVKNQAPAFVETVIPYFGQYGDGYDGYSLQNITNDLAMQLDIPYPVGSQNGVGIGGGWTDFAPFPNAGLQAIGGRYAYVVSITNPNVIVVSAAAPGNVVDPNLIARITNVSWITDETTNNNGWRVNSAQVVSFTAGTPSGSLCNYTLTLNAPFRGNAGDYIFPSMVNGQNYVNTILSSFAGLGPGEINTLQSLYPNSYRQPLTGIVVDNIPTIGALGNPSVVDARFLKSLIVTNNEVFDASFYYNQTGTPTVSQSVNGSAPIVPTPIPSEGGTTGVGLYTPGRLGFYP